MFSLATFGQLIDDKTFDDVAWTKLLFSFGGGAHSNAEGSLFKILKVIYLS